jgi:hypothetical protein
MSLKNNKQTSLDFFIEKIVDLMIGVTFYENQRQDLQDAYKIAKAMHKEEMHKCASLWLGREIEKSTFKRWYNETFNK